MKLSIEDIKKLRDPSTTQLSFRNRDIKDTDIPTLLVYIPPDSKLKILDLGENPLTNACVTMLLIQFINRLESLTDVILPEDKISAENKKLLKNLLSGKALAVEAEAQQSSIRKKIPSADRSPKMLMSDYSPTSSDVRRVTSTPSSSFQLFSNPAQRVTKHPSEEKELPSPSLSRESSSFSPTNYDSDNILEEAPVTVIVYENTGTIVRINKMITAVLGYSAEDRPLSLQDLIHPEDIQRTLNAGETLDYFVCRCKHQNGQYVELSWGMKSFGDVIIAIADENALLKEYALQLLNILRDLLFTPFQSMILTSDEGIAITKNLLSSPSCSENQAEQLRKILALFEEKKRCIKDISESIKDMLTLSQLMKGEINAKIKVFNPTTLIKSLSYINKALALERKITLTSNTLEKMPMLKGGVDWLRKCLQELLTNAIKFTPENGNITLDLSIHEIDKKTEKSPQMITAVFTVTNSGPGISQKQIDALKNPQVTYYSEGLSSDSYINLGMGLPLVKRMMENMDGELLIENKENIGTSISLKIKLELAELRKKPSRDKGKGKRKEDIYHFSFNVDKKADKKTILVVDDQPLCVASLKALLERAGFKVLTAQSGQEAIKIVESTPTIDLILMDLCMPGMTGVQAAMHISEIEKTKKINIPKFLISGNLAEDTPLDSKQYFKAELPKPINGKTLFPAIDEALRPQAPCEQESGPSSRRRSFTAH